MFRTQDLPTRFWAKVDKRSTACWLWTAHKNEKGYGVVGIGKKNHRAHRVSYEMVNGTVPADLLVLHRCDNPSCVNPDHLFLGTQKDNIQDCISKKRHYRPRGEASQFAKITSSDVAAIRSDRRPQKEIAADYGLSQQSISNIKRRKRWAHL